MNACMQSLSSYKNVYEVHQHDSPKQLYRVQSSVRISENLVSGGFGRWGNDSGSQLQSSEGMEVYSHGSRLRLTV